MISRSSFEIAGSANTRWIVLRFLNRQNWKQKVRAAVPYVALTLVVLAALIYTLQLWKTSLSRPLEPVVGDAYTYPYIAKSLRAHAFLHNPRVGAPFGLDYYDMYQPDFFHQGILAGLMTFTANSFLVVNIYYLLSYLLVAWTAFYVLRRFGLSLPASFAASALYAFTPSHLYRSEYHLFLSEYYLIPPTILLIMRIMSDGPWGSARIPDIPLAKRHRARNLLCFGIPLMILVGGSGVYYAFYSALLLSLAAVYAVCRRERRYLAPVAIACAATVCLAVGVALLPVFFYHRQHGPNPEVVHRTVFESHLYSLKFADLYLPSENHPIRMLRQLSTEYNQTLPQLNGNESVTSTLGIFGAIGLTALLLYPIVGRAGSTGGVFGPLSILTIAAVLYGVTEGFGALFSFLITPEIRANTRIVFFIAFFSLAAFGLLADKTFSKLGLSNGNSVGCWFLLGLVLLVGLYDEGVTQMKPDYAAIRAAYNSDAHFIKRVDSQLPKGAAVLQLPYQSFPEAIGPNRMMSYDPLLAYVYSDKLRWSYPAMRGRTGDAWIQDLSSLPVPMLLPQAVLGGFSGIYIDRAGYVNSGDIESQLSAALGVQPIVSENGRLSFFSLARFATDLKRTHPAWPWNDIASKDLSKPAYMLEYISGIYGEEISNASEWRWCNQRGILGIVNNTGKTQLIDLVGNLSDAYPAPSAVRFRDHNTIFKAEVSSAGRAFDWPLSVQPGLNRIGFETDAPRVPAPNDPRAMYFRFEHLRIVPR